MNPHFSICLLNIKNRDFSHQWIKRNVSWDSQGYRMHSVAIRSMVNWKNFLVVYAHGVTILKVALFYSSSTFFVSKVSLYFQIKIAWSIFFQSSLGI